LLADYVTLIEDRPIISAKYPPTTEPRGPEVLFETCFALKFVNDDDDDDDDDDAAVARSLCDN